eukprot:jgi/Ulvmu1/1708/UM116_0021.1
MSSTQLQDRLAALKQKLKASDSKSKLSHGEDLPRADTGAAELDRRQADGEQTGTVACDAPLGRRAQQTAELDTDTVALQRKVERLEANVKTHVHSRHQLQLELDAANQKLTVLKEQLITSQTDAEESGRQLLEETAKELGAQHANEVQRLSIKLHDRERIIQQLEQKAVQHAADLQHSLHAKDSMEQLQSRVLEAESAATVAQQAIVRLTHERDNLEAVVGELTYEAERVQKLQLSTCQAQEEAKQASEAAYHAQALAQGAQAEAAHERKRASELQVRCLQLEQQLTSLGSEFLSLQNHVERSSTELSRWQQSSVSPEDRDNITNALLALVKGESDPVNALEKIGELLKVEGSDLEELKAHGQHISRNKGFLQRFRRLPGPIVRDGDTARNTGGTDTATSGDQSIATSWASFLLTDDADAPASSNAQPKVGSS